MAAAGTDDLKPRQRRSSFEFLPPNMSELRLVLLGNSWYETSSVGNFILGETEFNTQTEPDSCVRVRGHLKKKSVVLISTPNLLHPNTSDRDMRKHVEECVSLSHPGPHVLLLVLNCEDFTEEHKQQLCRVLELFSNKSFDHSLILLSGENYSSHLPVKDMIRKCRYRYLKMENLNIEELLTRLGQTAKENSREHLRCDAEDQDTVLTIKPSLNLVLCGRRGAGKTSAAQAILGQTELRSASNSAESVKYEGEVCGRWVSLVELPALYRKPLEKVMQESFRCISLCDPEGVHAFVLVIPVGPLTDEDKEELETIKNTLSSQIYDFIMILFCVKSDPTDPAVIDFLKDKDEIQELCQSCGGGYFVLNIEDQQQVSEMLDAVEMMSTKRSKCFTKDMFTDVQVKRVVDQENTNTSLKAELEDVKQKRQLGDEAEEQRREPLRMVLIGKTGSGRSSTANTILGKKHFKSTIFPKPNKTSEKATGEIDGRPLTVIRAPSLFNTTVSDSDLKQEFHKCLSMLTPGPHVFLLVMQIGNFTPEENISVELIKKYFGQKSEHFTIIIFTRGDDLENQSFESYIKDSDNFIKSLINDCGGRYQVFNNKDTDNATQVHELLSKIDSMVKENGGNCFKVFDNTDEVIQKQVEAIMKEKEEESKRKEESQTKKHKDDLKKTERKITVLKEELEREKTLQVKEQKEKDRRITKELELRKREREEDEKRRKKQEETLRQDHRKKVEEAMRRVQSEREQKEAVERQLEQCRKEMKRDREAWNKEKKDMWEGRHQDLKQSLDEEKTRSSKLQEEYYRRRKTWIGCIIALSSLLFILFLYFLQGQTNRDVREQQEGTREF